MLLPIDDPLHVTINNDTTLTPTFNAPTTPGAVHFKLTVTDGAATVSATHNMDITLGGNNAPISNAGPDQSGIAAGATVTLDGSGTTDPEGHSITYAWTQVDDLGGPVPPGPGKVTLSSATAQKPTFTAPGNGPVTLHFQLVATDQFAAVERTRHRRHRDQRQRHADRERRSGPERHQGRPGRDARRHRLDGSRRPAVTYLWTQVDDLGVAVTPGPGKVTLSSATASQPTFPRSRTAR